VFSRGLLRQSFAFSGSIQVIKNLLHSLGLICQHPLQCIAKSAQNTANISGTVIMVDAHCGVRESFFASLASAASTGDCGSDIAD
jgi:hypothetical protein